MHPSREALASLRGRRYWPPHDGVRRMRWNNLNIVLPRRNHVPCELTSSIVPARGALPPGGTQYPRSGCCIGFLTPAELRAVCPHPVQDDGEASSQGDDRLLASATASDLHTPSLEPGPFSGYV